MNFVSVIQSILVLVLVIALANFSLKLLNKHIKYQNKIINIVERVSVSNSSSICVVKIIDSYYLMSLSNGENKIIKELDGEDIEEHLKEIQESRKFTYENISLNKLNTVKKKARDYFRMGKKCE